MPFKPGKSPNDLNKRIRAELFDISEKTESAVLNTGRAIAEAADNYVPIDTYELIQSRRVFVNSTPNGYRCTIRYGDDGALKYAAVLHEWDGWNPRQAGDPSKRGSGLNLQATAHWLIRGYNETNVNAVFESEMRKQ